MKKVELNKLEGLNYEEGKKLLLNNGYVQNNSGRSDGVDCDYILDTYFTLFDETNEETDVKSFVQKFNKNDEILNDDGSGDFLLSEEWANVM